MPNGHIKNILADNSRIHGLLKHMWNIFLGHIQVLMNLRRLKSYQVSFLTTIFSFILKLEINNRRETEKFMNTKKLKSLLNNQWIKVEIK